MRILAKPVGFPQIPDPRKDCHLFQANPGERHQQYVLCPEQDYEWLVYMSDQNTSMIEALDVQDHPLWKQRMQEYHDWQQKINKGSKMSKESWTWQEGTSSKWPTTSKGSSKPGQSVPVDISKRTNPERIQHAQPHWAQQIVHPCQPAPPPRPSGPSQPSSSSSASMVPVKPAPMAQNSSMASAPPSSQSPPSMGIDPWAEARMKPPHQ